MENKKQFKKIFFVLLLVYIVLALIVSIYRRSRITYIKCNDTYEVILNEKQLTTKDSIYEKAGTYTIEKVVLPDLKKIKDPALCFEFYNTSVEAFYKGKKIAEKGVLELKNHKMIGHNHLYIHLPKEAKKKDIIELKITAQNEEGPLVIPSLGIMEYSKSYLYSSIGKEVDMFFYIFTITGSLILFVIYLLTNKDKEMKLGGFYITLFTLFLSLWSMGYHGLLSIFSVTRIIEANLEYISLFIIPIPFFLYMKERADIKIEKIIHTIFAAIFGIFFIIINVLILIKKDYYYTNANILFRKMLLVAIIFLITFYIIKLILYKKRKIKLEVDQVYLMGGILLSFILLLIQFIIYSLTKYSLILIDHTSLLPTSFSALGTFSFVLTITGSYITRLLSGYMGKQTKNKLEKMAWIDDLTGIPNRAACDKQLKGINLSNDSVCWFIDLNFLKRANDNFGHKAGDDLLIAASTCIYNTFKDIGFCGRWGGDEFIAISVGERAEKTKERLDRFMAEYEKPLSVPLSMAVGYIDVPPQSNLSVYMGKAELKMYENKKAMKASRE